MVSTDHFRHELRVQLSRAAAQGATTIVVTSAELGRSLRAASQSSQACCEAMQAEVQPGDTVIEQSRSGGMTVRYLLPRGPTETKDGA